MLHGLWCIKQPYLYSSIVEAPKVHHWNGSYFLPHSNGTLSFKKMIALCFLFLPYRPAVQMHLLLVPWRQNSPWLNYCALCTTREFAVGLNYCPQCLQMRAHFLFLIIVGVIVNRSPRSRIGPCGIVSRCSPNFIHAVRAAVVGSVRLRQNIKQLYAYGLDAVLEYNALKCGLLKTSGLCKGSDSTTLSHLVVPPSSDFQ